ncbi:MAG: hypothetical protein WAL16_20800 [Streptosporangiaceae bacterium]
MSPPTEQLIRDYLNRLSVAARGQLGPDDRRALVSRTRDFIERKTALGGPPTAVEVARLLSGLGDPAGLVRQERQRLAAVRGEALEPVTGSRLTRALRGGAGRARGASWHWPVQEGSRADLQLTLLGGSEGQGAGDGQRGDSDGGGGEPARGNGIASSKGTGSGPETTAAGSSSRSGAVVPRQTDDRDGPRAWRSGGGAGSPGAPDRPPGGQKPGTGEGPRDSQPSSSGRTRPAWPVGAAGSTVLNGTPLPSGTPDPAGGAVPSGGAGENPAGSPGSDRGSAGTGGGPTAVMPQGPGSGAGSGGGSGARAAAMIADTVSWARSHPLEAFSVALLGLGGLIFPPVWLLGAAVALASRRWDYRDKWLGLALPILLAVIGTAAGFAEGGGHGGGVHHGLHMAWVYADIVSRLAAVLGAAYLAWRTVHVRRPPAGAPWNRPHKAS